MFSILGKLASLFGINLTPAVFIAGLVLGAAGGGFVSYKAGHWVGYDAGYAAADKQAEINKLQLDLANAKVDLSAATTTAEQAEQDRIVNEKARKDAEERVDAYAKELAARSDAGRCGFTADDLRWMRDDTGDQRKPDGKQSDPAGSDKRDP